MRTPVPHASDISEMPELRERMSVFKQLGHEGPEHANEDRRVPYVQASCALAGTGLLMMFMAALLIEFPQFLLCQAFIFGVGVLFGGGV